MKKKYLLIAAAFFLLYKEVFSMGQLPQQGDTLLYLANANYKLQTGLYDVYKTKQANIVMLGNSITHGVNWFELLGRTDIVERGIPSDILEGFLARMQYVYKLNPKICFVMGGINDIYSGIPMDKIFENYKNVISGLKQRGIIPVIQSTLYVSPKWHSAAVKNPEVKKFNLMLREYAQQNNIDFLDLNPLLTVNNFLKDEFTYDGLHLKGEAYRVWGLQLESIIKKHGL